MPGGDTRGKDLNSWWTNRATYRKDVAQSVSRLRELQAKLAAAAGSAQPHMPAPTESADELAQKADKVLADLAEARAQLPKLSTALEADRQSMQSQIVNVRSSASHRVRTENEMAVKNAHQAARDGLKQRQKVKKMTAAGIAVVVLFLMLYY